MSAATPAVSVIMPTYNGAALVAETVESVLNQSLPDFELVIVDDASTDDTLDRLSAFADPRIRIIPSVRNQGPVIARNRAFAAARGRYIAGLDQDDLCHPDRLARQVGWLDAHPDHVLLASAVEVLMPDGRRIADASAPARTSPALLHWLLHFGNPLTWSSCMIRADAARRLDLFERPDRLFAEDFDLYHRLAGLGPIARLDAPLLTYRWNAGGASRRYIAQMTASAVAVLADAYRPAFGAETVDAADRVLRQIGGSAPVRDPDDLRHLSRILDRVHRHYRETYAPAPADLTVLDGHYGRLWWKVAESAVRAGTISLGTALAIRPRAVALRWSRPRRLLASGMIGRARAMGLLAPATSSPC